MTDDFSSGELSGLPTLSEKLSAWFGCQIHLPPLPQTVKNLDKAIGRLVDCGSSFLERNATLRRAKTKLDEQLIDAAGKRASQEIIAGGPIAERALDYTLRESILRQTNRETIARLAIQHVVQKSEQNPADATAEIEDDCLPIRLMQTPATCRVRPRAGIKFGIGRRLSPARDAEQRAEGVERVEPSVEAERELIEVGL